MAKAGTLPKGVERVVTADGTMYRARWYDGMTQQRSKLVNTITEAKEIYAEKIVEKRRKQDFPHEVQPSKYTVKELLAEYGKYLQDKADYKNFPPRETWWNTYYGDRSVFSLTLTDLKEAREQIRKPKKGKPRRPGTVNHYLKVLRAAMMEYVQPASFAVDLWHQFELEDPKPVKSFTLSPATEGQLREELGPDNYDIVRLDILIGLRRGQFFSLMWEWVRWDLNCIFIPAFKEQAARAATIPRGEAITLLRALWIKAGRPKSGYLFPHATRPNEPVVANDWYRYIFKKATKATGLWVKGRTHGNVTFHGLRRTWATRIGQTGAHIKTLQRAAHWSNSDLAAEYMEAFDTDVRRAIEAAAEIGPGGIVRHSHSTEAAG